MKAPWFPFYCGDFLASSDVQLMEAAEVGAYVLLLVHSWQSDTPGFLPNDENRLRRLCRLSAEAWKESGELLLSKWPITENAELRFNPRLKKEAEKQVQLRELKAEAGKKSAERRATQRQQPSNTNPTGVEIKATGVGQNGNYSQSQLQPQLQPSKEGGGVGGQVEQSPPPVFESLSPNSPESPTSADVPPLRVPAAPPAKSTRTMPPDEAPIFQRPAFNALLDSKEEVYGRLNKGHYWDAILRRAEKKETERPGRWTDADWKEFICIFLDNDQKDGKLWFATPKKGEPQPTNLMRPKMEVFR